MMQEQSYIRFLGTGAGDYHCDSHSQCDDEYCGRSLKLGGRNIRHSPSLFVSSDTIVDFGEGTAGQLATYNIPADSIQNLFISHSHYDHFYPEKVLDFASGFSHPLNVYGSAAAGGALAFAASHRWDASTKRVTADSRPNNCTFHQLTPGTPMVVGNTEIVPVLSSHMIEKEHLILTEQALNFVFTRSNRSLFYNLDSSYLLPETLKALGTYRLDVAIMDATFGYLEINPLTSGHHNFAMMREAIALMREAGSVTDATSVVYSHISTHSVPPHDDIVEKLAEENVILAYDGLMLEF